MSFETVALNDNHDFTLNTKRDHEAIKQNIKTKIYEILGDSPINRTAGLDTFNLSIDNMPFTLIRIKVIVLSVQGVTKCEDVIYEDGTIQILYQDEFTVNNDEMQYINFPLNYALI